MLEQRWGRLVLITAAGGVYNLTDEDPIIYPSDQQMNTDPATYDVLGRRYFFAATYSFD